MFNIILGLYTKYFVCLKGIIIPRRSHIVLPKSNFNLPSAALHSISCFLLPLGAHIHTCVDLTTLEAFVTRLGDLYFCYVHPCPSTTPQRSRVSLWLLQQASKQSPKMVILQIHHFKLCSSALLLCYSATLHCFRSSFWNAFFPLQLTLLRINAFNSLHSTFVLFTKCLHISQFSLSFWIATYSVVVFCLPEKLVACLLVSLTPLTSTSCALTLVQRKAWQLS